MTNTNYILDGRHYLYVLILVHHPCLHASCIDKNERLIVHKRQMPTVARKGWTERILVIPQLCRLYPVYAYAVALKPLMGK